MASLKLSCGDHSFPLLNHDLALDLIAGLGFEGFDLALMGNRSHLRPENVRDDIEGSATSVRAAIVGRGLEVADLFVIPWTEFERYAPNSPDENERAESRALFLDMARFASIIRAPGITMVPGLDFEMWGHRDSLARAAEELQWRAEYLKREGMAFSVECHIGSVAASPTDALELVAQAPDLTLTLDYTHFIAPGFTQLEVDPLIPFARHVQVRGARPSRGQVGMRENTIDYEAVVDRLTESGYDGFVSVEYVWIDWERMNECDNISETILMRDRLRAKFANKPWSFAGSIA
jgi:sugar phosphate isomerase/epimerase